MKQTALLSIFCLLALFQGRTQVGIGTTNPQEELHVAGNSGTIRIDGLNSTNHVKNLGGTDMYNVMVDANGNLSLSDRSGSISSGPEVNTPVVITSAADSSLNSGEIYTKSFTLPQRALVVITYYISMDFMSYDGSAMLDDGRAKIAHNYFYLGDGVTADTSKSYGMTSSVYSNSNCDTATGYVYNSRSMTIALDAGTYSIHLQGAAYGGGLTADAAFEITFGDLDRLDIQAIYL